MGKLITWGTWDEILREQAALYNIPVNFTTLILVWLVLYSIVFAFCSLIITPDIDLKLRLIMKHRTYTHSIWLLGILFGYLSWKYGTWWSGGFVACLSHIVTDDISTFFKRLKTKIKRALHF
jgi:membrane-bound metal-dependent hydrolase YbcI (DUF457 family)